MYITEFLKKLNPKYRKLINYLKTNTDIDLKSIDLSWKTIKKYLNPKVEKLSLFFTPEISENIKDLKNYNYLKELDLGENIVLTEDILKEISNIGIKKITLGDIIINENNKSLISINEKNNSTYFYNDLEIITKIHSKITENKTLELKFSELNKASQEKVLSILNLNDYEKLTIITNTNKFILNFKENKITINGSNINELYMFYNFIIEKNININELELNIKNKTINLDYIKRVLYIFSENDKKTIKISIENNLNEIYGKFKIEGKTLYIEDFLVNELNDIDKLYSFLKKLDFKLKKLELNLNNTNKYDINYDYELLQKLNKNVEIIVEYGIFRKCTFNEFLPLLWSIKYYRKLINDYDLSPVEKVMFAYDLVKSFQYKSNGKTFTSRDPHSIITSGKIVCVGYASLLVEILDKIDPNIGINEDNLIIPHTLNEVRIDDEKYNIHGIFILDATFDSDFSNEDKNYQTLDLYTFFLLNIKEYLKLYNNSTSYLPESINALYKEENERKPYESWRLDMSLKKLIGSKNEKKFKTYLKSKRSSLEDFIKMLTTVRKCEGFDELYISKEIKRITKNNQKFSKELNNLSFFETERKIR